MLLLNFNDGFFPSTYLLHSFRIIFMALIYFAYKVLTFQFCEIFCMNGNKSSLFSSPRILENYFARRKILAETFELSVSAKFPLSWILPKVRACRDKDKQITRSPLYVLPDGPVFEFISSVFCWAPTREDTEADQDDERHFEDVVSNNEEEASRFLND